MAPKKNLLTDTKNSDIKIVVGARFANTNVLNIDVASVVKTNAEN